MFAERLFQVGLRLLIIAAMVAIVLAISISLSKPQTARIDDTTYNAHEYIFPDGMTPIMLIDGDKNTISTHMIFLCQYQEIYITCSPEIVPFEDIR